MISTERRSYTVCTLNTQVKLFLFRRCIDELDDAELNDAELDDAELDDSEHRSVDVLAERHNAH